jgi:hypothetical protein
MLHALKWFIEPLYLSAMKASKFMQIYSQPREKAEYYFTDSPGQLRQATTPKIFFEEINRIMRCINVYIA